MAGNPRIVTADVVFLWDGVSQRLARGTILDVPAGSALERAIGGDRLIPLHGAPPAAPQPAASASAPAPAPQPPARKSTARDSSDGKGGQF